jgi:hydroxyacylglutathione hydrolase
MMQLTDDLYIDQSRLYQTNSGAFISQGQALLIDPCIWPEEIDALAAAVADRGAEPRWLLLTHSHWDHILGPERLRGVPIVAQALFAETAARTRAETEAELRHWAESHGGPRREAPLVVPEPALAFERQHTLPLGALQLRLLHVPGHAADQAAVYEPASACLWAADMLSDVEIPFVERLGDYERTLDMLAGLELRALVPGHGTPTASAAEIHARLQADRAYLAELRQRVALAVQRGQSLAEAQAACASMHFRNPHENAEPHRQNVQAAYQELAAGNTQHSGDVHERDDFIP